MVVDMQHGPGGITYALAWFDTLGVALTPAVLCLPAYPV
jgi:hypothetical protein